MSRVPSQSAEDGRCSVRERFDKCLLRYCPDQEPSACIALIDEIINHTPRGNLYRAQMLLPYKGKERQDASLFLDNLLDEKRAYFEKYTQLNLLGEVRL